MVRAVGRWFVAAVVILPLAVAGTALSKPAVKPVVKVRTADQAVKLLATAQGEDLAAATNWLEGQPDLLTKQARLLTDALGKAPADAEFAGRVLGLLDGRGPEGCAYAASLVGIARPGVTEAMLFQTTDVMRCAAMSGAMANLLRSLPDPLKNPAAERIALRVLEIARNWRDASAARTACRFILSGSDRLRHEALATMMAARPAETGECLVQAYAEESSRPEGDASFRADLLNSVVVLTGLDSVPTLRLALEQPADRDLACTLLQGRGAAALEGLIFAIRTGDARSEGVRSCLHVLGGVAIPGVLPLLDHPSARIRAFAIEFLKKFRSPEARDALQKRFLAGGGSVDRQVLLGLLAAYPSVEVEETFREALSSPDARMRRAGLDAVESSQATNLLKHLREIAEEDGEAPLRRRALEVAWRLDDLTILPLARRMATYEEPVVATMAIRILGFLGGRDDAAIVAKLLGHKEPEVAAAALEAAWVLSLAEPRKGGVEYLAAPKRKAPGKVREIACEGLSTKVIGKKGPLVVVLPGGPAMDLTWAWPSLEDLADDAVVAFVSPVPVDGAPAAAGLVQPAQIECVRQALGGGRVVLLSRGLGGTWALSLAAALPDAVAGVAALMAPLPGRLQEVDDALRVALKPPFQGLVASILETRARFAPAALNAYLARLFAPAMAGKAEPAEALGLAWDAAREDRAIALLDRPEVRFVPAESRARFLIVVPAGLTQAAVDAYGALATSASDRVTLQSFEGCGFLPEVACTSKVVKAIEGLVRAANAGVKP
jgi:pimeloyl-ACP methyl ester carboxylesterase